jgi:hypothetical protein
LSFEAEAGHTYIAKGKIVSGVAIVWLEDAETGEVVVISQMWESTKKVSIQNCIFGMRNPHFGWSVGFGYLYVTNTDISINIS